MNFYSRTSAFIRLEQLTYIIFIPLTLISERWISFFIYSPSLSLLLFQTFFSSGLSRFLFSNFQGFKTSRLLNFLRAFKIFNTLLRYLSVLFFSSLSSLFSSSLFFFFIFRLFCVVHYSFLFVLKNCLSV
jgi:hypothetical protein